jgi:4-amino-4-deoxy-L-arabinose transferase-like glycosyltransferase
VNTRKALLVALAMGVLYIVALAYPVHRHVVGAFSDFYVRFAPDADRVAAGEFPRNTYNPPGYPTLLALASPLTGDHFTTAKWMSLLAGGLTGALAFVLFRRLFEPGPALLAVPIVLTSAVFATYAISAMTDVPFVLLCLVVMIATTREGPHRLRGVIVSGVLCGVAYLIRYNAVFLLVPGLVAALWGQRRWTARAGYGGAYLASVLVTVAPWLWMNYTHHGSPFYSTNYEDVARAFEITRSTPFTSLGDVLFHAPTRFARGYITNLGYTFFQTLGAGLALLPVGPLAAIGMGLCLARHRRKPVLLVLLAALSFLLVMSLTHWERRYFFFILVCYSGFAAFAIFEIARWVGRALGSTMASHATMAVLVLWIVIPSIVTVWQAAAKTLSRQPVELLPAAEVVRREAPPRATVMAVRAQMAYLSRREWRPLPGADSLPALKTLLHQDPPGYIVYDRWARKYLPQLKALLDPAASPSWLRAVYSQPGIVVYRVQMDQAK